MQAAWSIPEQYVRMSACLLGHQLQPPEQTPDIWRGRLRARRCTWATCSASLSRQPDEPAATRSYLKQVSSRERPSMAS